MASSMQLINANPPFPPDVPEVGSTLPASATAGLERELVETALEATLPLPTRSRLPTSEAALGLQGELATAALELQGELTTS